MKVSIELFNKHIGIPPTKNDMQRSIDAVNKLLDGKALNGVERILVVDVVSILKALQKELPPITKEQSHDQH